MDKHAFYLLCLVLLAMAALTVVSQHTASKGAIIKSPLYSGEALEFICDKIYIDDRLHKLIFRERLEIFQPH